MSRIASERGFTLIEVLVSIAISVVVFSVTLSVLDVFQRANRTDTLRNEAQDEARTTLDLLARELRNGAAPSSTTPGALEKAGKYSIVFQTIEPTTAALKGSNKTNAIRVRYCLDRETPAGAPGNEKATLSNEFIWKQTKKWETESAPALPTTSTCPDLNKEDYETATVVAHHVVNRNGGRTTAPLFTYVPSTFTEVSQITGVEPNIYLNVAPKEKHPGETQLTSAIDLRNENRPPTASFTAKEVGKQKVVLNGTQSTDPDGLALTFKWWDNGTRLGSTSSETETSYELVVGSEHTFKLEVTTPSGLTASATATLKIT